MAGNHLIIGLQQRGNGGLVRVVSGQCGRNHTGEVAEVDVGGGIVFIENVLKALAVGACFGNLGLVHFADCYHKIVECAEHERQFLQIVGA